MKHVTRSLRQPARRRCDSSASLSPASSQSKSALRLALRRLCMRFRSLHCWWPSMPSRFRVLAVPGRRRRPGHRAALEIEKSLLGRPRWALQGRPLPISTKEDRRSRTVNAYAVASNANSVGDCETPPHTSAKPSIPWLGPASFVASMPGGFHGAIDPRYASAAACGVRIGGKSVSTPGAGGPINFVNPFGPIDSTFALDGVVQLSENGGMETPGEIAFDKLQILVLERTDPSRNMARFYVLAIEPTLFGDAALVREWGRLGSRGRRRLDLHANKAIAAEALEVWLDRKVRRGYQVRASHATI